jgi:uncharacterized protein
MKPEVSVGGIQFDSTSLIDFNKLHKDWYDWTLKDGTKPEFLKDRITYYMAGAEEWRYASGLDSMETEKQVLFLHSDGTEQEVFHSGILTVDKPRNEKADHFTYDPLDVSSVDFDMIGIGNQCGNWVTDQRYALNPHLCGLVYHTQPFESETELCGPVRFVCWLLMDVKDTDLETDLYEIKTDGSAVLLTSAMMRARYRDSLEKENLVEPGEITRFEFGTGFNWFARRIEKGSRLRLIVYCNNSIFWEKNYNSGGIVAEETAKDAKIAHITLYHDMKHPSFLELPLDRHIGVEN